MRDYRTPIGHSALHVYHSGVVSMPECTLTSQVQGTYSTALLISERDHAWQTEHMILEGHTGKVQSVAFSPDGSHIVSGSDDHTMRVWDAVSGALLHTSEGHTGWVTSVTFSPDGLRIVSGFDDHTARIWDAETGALQRIIEGYHGQSLQSILDDSVLPNGRRSSLL
jgi:WD40 repeat protein